MVTGPHGKGISVCDMLIRNQRKDTMDACLRFFKEKIGPIITESFVIDKDFTEWAVLENLFPDAKVWCGSWLWSTSCCHSN